MVLYNPVPFRPIIQHNDATPTLVLNCRRSHIRLVLYALICGILGGASIFAASGQFAGPPLSQMQLLYGGILLAAFSLFYSVRFAKAPLEIQLWRERDNSIHLAQPNLLGSGRHQRLSRSSLVLCVQPIQIRARFGYSWSGYSVSVVSNTQHVILGVASSLETARDVAKDIEQVLNIAQTSNDARLTIKGDIRL